MVNMTSGCLEALAILIKYLADNHHPHTKIIIENGNVELVESVMGIRIYAEPENFLKET